MTQITCPKCGKVMWDQLKDCPHCQFPVQQHMEKLRVQALEAQEQEARRAEHRFVTRIFGAIMVILIVINMLQHLPR